MPDTLYHVRQDWSAAGWFGFKRTLVKYGHNGIQKLKHYVPQSQQDWAEFTSSGAHTFGYNWDSSTARVSKRITCTTVGIAIIRKRIQLPRDFGEFVANGFSIVTMRSAAITHLVVAMQKGGVTDSTINGVSISPASATVWETFTFTPGSTYSPGDWVTVIVQASLDTIGDIVDVADLSMLYVNARGNV